MIEVRDISVVRQGTTLLEPLSVTLEAGQFVAIIGPNGAGKSTFLKTLAGASVSGGSVVLNGEGLASMSYQRQAQQRGVMLQFDGLQSSLSVIEVLQIGLLPFENQLDRAGQRACLDAAIAHADLDIFLERNYPSLSGGERARVRFARLCVQLFAAERLSRTDVGILALLDEPLAALDLRQQRLMMNAMQALVTPGRAVVAVVHDLNWLAGFVDRVLVLVKGRLVADDRPERVLRNPLLSEWFNTSLVVNEFTGPNCPFNNPQQRLSVSA